jgi:signal transduction histidine kinase
VKETFYRIAQEASTNINKHAHASRVDLSLENNGEELKLEISDNGIGFDPKGEFPGHLGLRSMRERAAKNGIRFTIFSKSGEGTRIVCALPLERRK